MVNDIEIRCRPRNLPSVIELDISNLGLGGNLQIKDLVEMDGVTYTSPHDTILISCVKVLVAALVLMMKLPKNQVESMLNLVAKYLADSFKIIFQPVCQVSCTAIIGLGNPGIQYANSRHNLGFWLLDKFAESQKINFIEKSKYCAEICKMSFQDQSFMLVKPFTFMNESGKFLKNLLSSNNCEFDKTILVHDELTLPVGRMKISVGQGDGGHNGVKSVFPGLGKT